MPKMLESIVQNTSWMFSLLDDIQIMLEDTEGDDEQLAEANQIIASEMNMEGITVESDELVHIANRLLAFARSGIDHYADDVEADQVANFILNPDRKYVIWWIEKEEKQYALIHYDSIVKQYLGYYDSYNAAYAAARKAAMDFDVDSEWKYFPLEHADLIGKGRPLSSKCWISQLQHVGE